MTSQQESQPTFAAKRCEELIMKMLAIHGQWGKESQVAEFIKSRLVDAGISARSVLRDTTHKHSPFGGECGNLIVKLPGTTGRKKQARRMLMAHMDTVPLAVGSKPVRKGKRIVSQDSTTALGGDDRAGSAAILSALLTILENKLPHPPLTFLWTVQEEVGLCGARYGDIAKLAAPQLAFNFDGGEPAFVTLGATGAYRMNIRVRGIAAHAGVHPEQGVSATAIASLAIADLQRQGWHGLITRNGVRGTSNVGVFRGGEATNVVTDDVFIRAEARAHSKKMHNEIVRAYKQAFASAARTIQTSQGKAGSVKFEVDHDYESFQLSPKTQCVVAAENAIRSLGLDPVQRVVDGGLDANWINHHGIPTVTLGCGQHNIHTVAEYLDVAEYLTGCRLALRLATDDIAEAS